MTTLNRIICVLGAVAVAASSSDPAVDVFQNCSQISKAVTVPGSSTAYVTYLGMFNNTKECIDACLTTPTTRRCYSYTYFTDVVASYSGMCYGRFGEQNGKVWIPVPQHGANCGRVVYPCQSDADCNYNGKCDQSSGTCTCTPAWGGPTCQDLQLLPATRGSGYNESVNRISSWGGSVIIDDNDNNNKTKYHMYLSEFDNHCGLESWTRNSILTHAQSTNGFNSKYEKKGVIRGHFTHEPNVMKGPKGQVALFYSAVNSTVPECNCTDGSTPPSCKKGSLPHFQEVLAISEGPSGPWKTCIVFKNRTTPLDLVDDTNLSGVVLPNGSFVGLLRHWNNSFDGSQMHVVTSDNWEDCDSYKLNDEVLFPELPHSGTEDPHVYRDCEGRYHSIFHNMAPGFDHSVVGGHGYSIDGQSWTYSGTIYGDLVKFTDGTQFSFIKRARPHFIFADDGCTPLALTNGVVYGGTNGDASFTFLQPLRV